MMFIVLKSFLPEFLLGLVIFFLSFVFSCYFLGFLKGILVEPQAVIFIKSMIFQVLFINPTLVLLVCQQTILGLFNCF